MRKAYNILLTVALSALAACSSQTEEITYRGENYVQFSDSTFQMPVTEDEKVFEVPVVMSRTCAENRNVIVDIDAKNTNATEGYHFVLESRNVTIPAGQLAGKARLRASYKHLTPKDSLAITLRIVGDQSVTSPLYGNATNVRLVKCMPFHIDDYVGDMLLTCTFPFSTSATSTFLLSSEKIDETTLQVNGPFEEKRNLILNFHDGKDDPFDRNIDMREQVAFTDVTFGQVSMATVPNAPSYYIPSERAFVLYLDAYLAGMGTFGAFYYVFQWITPDEAEARRNGLSTLY